jgi:hypothetical protein
MTEFEKSNKITVLHCASLESTEVCHTGSFLVFQLIIAHAPAILRQKTIYSTYCGMADHIHSHHLTSSITTDLLGKK